MEAKLCQSCGMPLSSAEVLGTNADGSLNEEYCTIATSTAILHKTALWTK